MYPRFFRPQGILSFPLQVIDALLHIFSNSQPRIKY